MIPEYYPPPRTEAWLTLPPGAVVARDDPDWEPRRPDEPRYPVVRSEVALRFRNEFGNEAALAWDLEPDRFWLMDRTMREVFCGSLMEKMLYKESPFHAMLEKGSG